MLGAGYRELGIAVFSLAAASGCRGVLGIEDPVFVEGDVIPGVELSSLMLSTGELDRSFDGTRAVYSVALELAAEELVVTATAESTDLTIFVDGAEVTSGEPAPPFEVAPGRATLEIAVARPSTGEQSRYTLALDRTPRFSAAVEGDGEFADRFGDSFQLDDDLLFVGAPCATAAARSHAGLVYIFQHESDGAWTLAAELSAQDPAENQFFGSSLSHDGGVLAIGADGGDRCGAAAGPRTGRAFVFEQVGDSWMGTELTPGVVEPGTELGRAVSVDGDFIAVGAPRQTSANRSGAVFLFARAGGTWTQSSRIDSPDGDDGDLFGVAIDLNSNVLAVGAPGAGGGKVHVFHNQSGVAVPLGVATPSPDDVAQLGPLGFGLALAQEDDAIAIGGPTAESDSGAVWIFELDSQASRVELDSMIVATVPAEGDRFGAAVDIDEDLVAVGAPGELGNTGGAYLWLKTDEGWDQVTALAPAATSAGAGFGSGIDIDELRVIVGAPTEREGFAYLLE